MCLKYSVTTLFNFLSPLFIIDPPEKVCAYLAQGIINNKKTNVRIVWMTPWRLLIRFFQPYYWRRNPIKDTALEHLK
ncbi:MAG: hypothetical protein I8H74_12115 [Moraxellaceae bacterium]|nr:hypothetical protein [Moraxellaceae bacterium]